MTHDPQTRKRALTPEEAELWQYAMRQAKAMRRRDRDHARSVAAEAAQAVADAPEDANGMAAAKAVGNAKHATKPSSSPSYVPAPPPTSKSPPPLSPFDERQHRKIARDTDLIDARLDLHGMRQREAHGALIAFLRSCVARGMRHVLVITGKGTAALSEPRDRDFYREERGVLRRLVPEWLAGPDLRGIVVSYAASHVRHGGEGALYVRLRKAPLGR